MQLINLDQHRRKEVVATLESLLAAAKAGELVGLVYVAQLPQDEHCAGTSGTYRRFPEQALRATFALERALCRTGPFAESR